MSDFDFVQMMAATNILDPADFKHHHFILDTISDMIATNQIILQNIESCLKSSENYDKVQVDGMVLRRHEYQIRQYYLNSNRALFKEHIESESDHMPAIKTRPTR